MKRRRGGTVSRVFAFLVVFLSLGIAASSAPIQIRVATIEESAADGLGAVRIVATQPPKAGDGPSLTAPAKHVLTLDGAGEGTIELDAGTWQLTAEAARFWTPAETVSVEDDELSVRFELWPTGALRGTVLGSRNDELPPHLDIDFQSSPEQRGFRAVPPGRVSCPVDDRGTWTCEIPAGIVDLQLGAPEYIKQYRWDVVVRQGKATLVEPLELKRGSAVRGWIVTESGASAEDAAVELAPRLAGRPSEQEQARAKSLELSMKVNRRGFFQLDAVSPGDYVLTATKRPFSSVQASVRVLEGQPTEIVRPPLTLYLPNRLTIFVDPPVPPTADYWTAKLSRLDRSGNVLGFLDESEIPADGAWEVEQAPPGSYSLTLSMADLDRWFWQELEVDRRTSQLFVDVPVVEIEGTVTLGDDPLPSRLTFGGKYGAVSIHLQADEDGAFTGFLPGDGRWVVEVEADDPPIHRSFQRDVAEDEEVEIHIPSTRVRGVVVNEAGTGVASMVRIKNAGQFGMAADVATDEDGKFESIGLPAGRTSFVAEAYEMSSDVQEAFLEEDRDLPDLRLVLRRNSKMSGRIVSAAGSVPGARVTAFSVEAFYLGAPLRTSDSQGNFEVDVPAGTRSMIVQVAAPGFAFRTLRATPSEEPLVLPVSQDSGRLVVELPDSFDRGRWEAPQVILFHAASFVGLYRLQAWATSNGQAQEPGNRYVIPFMEPGDYQACQVQVAEALALLTGGSADVTCASGELPSAGELTLTLAD